MQSDYIKLYILGQKDMRKLRLRRRVVHCTSRSGSQDSDNPSCKKDLDTCSRFFCRVMSLVERGGKVQSRHVANVTAKSLKPVLVDAIAKDTNLRTDQSPVYTEIGTGFASHETVNHSIKEYVRGDDHTNTVEGYFSIFKRGVYGVYHHLSEQHLKRYLCEFDFRYNERIAL